MLLELEGKGVVCDIYYINEDKFLTLTADAENKHVGLITLIMDCYDFHIPVARGFFADNPDTVCKVIRDSGETILVEMNQICFLDKFLNGIVSSDIPDDSYDLDSFTISSCDEYPEPIKNQICLVVYSEFEYGKSTTSIPVDAAEMLKGLRFITKSVDCEGFVRRATYMENIVGSKEYNEAEQAIMGIYLNSQQFSIAAPIYERSDNRVWLYKFDESEQSHQLDFFASKKIRWLSASDDQSRTRIIVK